MRDRRAREGGGASERPKDPQSLHVRIVTDIERRILGGEWPPGHKIPFEHELMDIYRCSRMTVSKALTQLAQAGLIERRRKAGSFVTRPLSQSAVLEIRDIGAEVASLGLAYRYEILSRRRRRASAAEPIAAPAGVPLLAIVCRHDAGSLPFCYEDRLINLAAVPSAGEEAFATQSPGAWLMAQQPWTSAEHRIRAAAADGACADALGIAQGAPCLVVERRTWASGQPVTHVTLAFPAQAHELVAHFAPN